MAATRPNSTAAGTSPRGSFRPEAAITALRGYLRHRETLVQSAVTHIQRMQKALVQMNLQLHLVVTDITGVTGMRILRDIVAGQTDGQLAKSIHRCVTKFNVPPRKLSSPFVAPPPPRDSRSECAHIQRMHSRANESSTPPWVTDITGVTGMRILRDIVAGQTDPHRLAKHRDHRCQSSEDRRCTHRQLSPRAPLRSRTSNSLMLFSSRSKPVTWPSNRTCSF